MSKLRKLQQLSARDWWLLMQAQLLLPVTLVGVSVFGVTRWQHALAKLPQFRRRHVDGLDTPAETSRKTSEIALMVNVAATHGLFRAHCLQRSLVLWSLLERNGVESELRFGARKENGQIQAHAWVEINGVALNDDTHREFSSL